MADLTNPSQSLAELAVSRGHAGDFTVSRADFIITRLRPLSLALAVLLPAWIGVDYLLLPADVFVSLAVLRLVAGALAAVVYFLCAPGSSLRGAQVRLAALVAVPLLLYVAARLLLDAGADNMLYGYTFLPILAAAMLAVFPLTLLEGLLIGVPVLLSYAGPEFALGSALEPRWLGTLWLLAMVALISIWTQLSQLRMLLDLFGRATRDGITGALNRRSLAERLQAEHARWQRHSRPLAVLLVELGELEQIAHEHGHATANRLLAQLAEVVRRTLRPTDSIGRWDADTLLVLLPETDEGEAGDLASRVREVAELATVVTPAGTKVRGRARIAAAAPRAGEALEELLARVDRDVAAEGRRRVRSEEPA